MDNIHSDTVISEGGTVADRKRYHDENDGDGRMMGDENNDSTMEDHEDNSVAGNEHQTSKSRGAVTVQIFIKKTYKMINDCDPKIAAWSPDGSKFIIKDPDQFANEVIPQYFDHNKFSSFTRQLNFYKFTREQSKVIRKSDNSSDIAKHQTFHHKYFHRDHPELLKNLQRSRKGQHGNNNDGDDGGGGGGGGGGGVIANKKLKVGHGGKLNGNSILETVTDLVRRANESEMMIKNLQQENQTLSFAVQKLQQQDEMKQREIIRLQESLGILDRNATQAFQRQQSMFQQAGGQQPLPFGRESSLSAVSPNALMRLFSMNGVGNSASLQRRTTPPFGSLVGSAGGLGAAGIASRSLSQNIFSSSSSGSAAAAAESIVNQTNESAAAADIGSADGNGAEPTIKRHPRMKGRSAVDAAAASGGDGSSGPSLPRHPNMKSLGPSGRGGGGSIEEGTAPALNRNDNISSAQHQQEHLKAETLAALGVRRNDNATNSPVNPQSSLGGGNIGLNGFGLGVGGFGGLFHSNNFLGATGGFNAATAAALGNFQNGGLTQSTAQQQHAAAMAQNNSLLTRELSNMTAVSLSGGGVTREESFGIESLLDLSQGGRGNNGI